MQQILPEKQPLAVDRQAADMLIAAGDGDAALLYLYLLRQKGLYAEKLAAQDLSWSPKRVQQALEKLCRMELAGTGRAVEEPPAAQLLEPAEEPPRYDLEDVRRASGGEGGFAGLVTEVQRLLGRVLSGQDLLTLFGIYDHLGLPPEVILLLVRHCGEELQRRYGEGRRLSLRSVEKTAYHWARQDLRSLEKAEAYLQAEASRRTEAAQVQITLGIRDRQLSPSENRYIRSWLEMGYTAESLELAYDRTVLQTGGLNWKYMDSIVRSWQAKGLRTPAEIRARDGKKSGMNGKAGGSTKDDLALLRKQLGMK